MAGFGSDPFGSSAFGEFDWSKAVLFKLAPEIYQNSDTEDLFLQYAEAQGEVFDALRRRIADFGLLRDPWQVRTAYDSTEQLRLGRRVSSLGEIVAKGLNGSVDATLVFTAERARFTEEYLGRELIVSGASVEGNNTTVIIARVYDSFSLGTDPPLSVDAGPLTWRVRERVGVAADTIVVEVAAGDLDSIVPGWIVTDGGGEVEVTARAQFLLSGVEKQVLTEREGSDGAFVGTSFYSATANFTQRDVGKRITVSGSTSATNNGKFEISEVVNSSTVVLDSDDVVEDSGLLVWAILRRGRLTLTGPTVLSGILEQEGVDGEATGTGGSAGSFSAGSANFTELDVGKLLVTRKNGSSNNGVYEITTFVSSEEVTVEPDFPTLGAEADTTWEVRAATSIGDGTYVEAHAPSLLKWLAQDFAVPIDAREDEEWQRRWVASVSRWIGMKGLTEAYEFLAALTGYDATVTPLYRVDSNYSAILLDIGEEVYVVGEGEDGRSGTDASLSLVSGKVRVTSLTAEFIHTDADLEIELSGTDGGTNDGVYAIDTFIDSHNVDLDPLVSLTLPDANDGSIVWRVVRVYAGVAGSRPLLDEVNVDRMGELKTDVADFSSADFANTSPRYVLYDDRLTGPFSGGTLATRVVGYRTLALIEAPYATVNTYSEQLDNWGTTRASVTPNVINSPLSELTADLLYEDSTPADSHVATQDFTPDGSSSYCFSLWVKQKERYRGRILFSTAGFPAAARADFNLSDGTVVGTDVDFSGIVALNDDWYLVYFVATSDSATLTTARIYLEDDDGNINYDGDGSSGFYVWGANIIQADYLTSYIQAVASTVTKNEDILIWDSADLPSWLQGSQNKSFTFDFVPNYSSAQLADNGGKKYLFSINGTENVECYLDGADNTIKIDVDSVNVFTSTEKTWGARANLAITITPNTGTGCRVISYGFSSSDGDETGDAFSMQTDGDLSWGSRHTTDDLQFDGLLSEPRFGQFLVDMLCIDPDWSSLLGPGSSGDGLIAITAVDPAVGGLTPITFTVDAIGDFEVVVGLGTWKLTDADSAEFFLESLPEFVVESTSTAASILSGYDGRIQATGITFTSADVGKRIRISGSAVGNDDTYIIDSIVSSDTVDVDIAYAVPPVIPDPDNGSLTAEVLFWRFTVVATQPPTVGDASLEYICPDLSDCSWCKASKVLIEATTPYDLEHGSSRLIERLNQVKPKHVDIIEAFGVDALASVEASMVAGPTVLSFDDGTFTNPDERYIMAGGRMYGPYPASTLATCFIDGDRFAQIEDDEGTENTYSEAFLQASTDWVNNNCSVTSDDTTSPVNDNTADLLYEDSTPASVHQMYQSVTPDGASTYYFGAFFKQKERYWVRLQIANGAGFPGTPYRNFNVNSGTAGSGADTDDYGIIPLVDGWYYCYIAATSNAAAATNFRVYILDNAGNPTYDGDGSSGLYVWGANVIQTDYLSSYIQAVASTGSRTNDQFYWPAAVVAENSWVRDGFTVVVYPYYSNIQLGTGPYMRLFHFDDTNDTRGYLHNNKLYINHGGAILSSGNLSWEALSKLTVTIRFNYGGQSYARIEGLVGGTVEVYGTACTVGAGELEWGAYNQIQQFNGLLSEPKPVE